MEGKPCYSILFVSGNNNNVLDIQASQVTRCVMHIPFGLSEHDSSRVVTVAITN